MGPSAPVLILAHGPPAGPEAISLVGVLALGTLGALMLGLYLAAVGRQRRRRRQWRASRTGSFVLGVGLLGVAMAPPLASLAHEDLRAHMVQHLLLGMFAPTALVFGAPGALLLRSLPIRAARALVRLLRTPPVRLWTHPFTALVLNIGGMAALYLTPLYARMGESALLHALVHIHFVLAGALWAWSIASDERIGRQRPSHRVRLAALFLGIALHATLSKALYAWQLPAGHPVEEVEQAAQIMYYGGDLAELILLVALLLRWPGGAEQAIRSPGSTAP